MNRSLAALLLAATLVVGVAVGVLAGGLAGFGRPGVAQAGPTPSPSVGGATGSPSPTASPTPAPTPGATPSPTPEPTPTPQPTPKPVPAPLTGLPITRALANRHVVAVMVDDQALARPQSGFNDAGIVWQAPAEGGIPRYMMLFQDGDPPAVGPVRSARQYYIGWAAEWNAVYVHVGGSPQALATLHSAQGHGGLVFDADEFRYGGKYLWRITERNAPHNVYSDGKHLRALTKSVGAKNVANQAPFWRFGPDLPLADRPKGGTIVVPYPWNKITYRYDRATNTYPRTVTGEKKQVDAGTGQRVAPRNVVIMLMHFGPLNDGSKKHRLEAQQVGKGTAYIATNGKTVKGTWRKKALDAPTLFYGPSGKQVTLTAGQTFVQVVPVGTGLTIKDGTVPPPPPPVRRPATWRGLVAL